MEEKIISRLEVLLPQKKQILFSLLEFVSKQIVIDVPFKQLLKTIKQIIESPKQLVSLKSSEARKVSTSASKLADKIENIALGIYSDSADKLLEYGIKKRKTAEPKPSPTKTLIPALADDTDGEGFIVSTQTDPNADYYEPACRQGGRKDTAQMRRMTKQDPS